MLTPRQMLFSKNQGGGNDRKAMGASRSGWFANKLAHLSYGVALLLVLVSMGCTPAGPRALLEGERLIKHGRYQEAVTELKTATSLLSTNAHAWNYLGLAHQYAGQPVEAEAAYQRALVCNRDLMEARYNLGCLLLAEGKFDAARTQLTAYNLRRGNSAMICLKLGQAQLGVSDLAGAERSFGEALRQGNPSPEAWNGLGLVHARRNRSTEALQDFNQALKLRPDFAPALLNSAILLQREAKDHPAALRGYRQYLSLSPRPPNAEAVGALVHQLEAEINPAPTNPPAGVGINSSPIQAGTPSPPRSPTTNSLRPVPQPRTDSMTNSQKPGPTVVALPRSAPATNVTASALELPKPRTDLAGKPGPDLTAKLQTNPPTRPVVVEAPPLRTVIASNATAAIGLTQRVASAQPDSKPVPAGRYPYHTIPAPQAGDRAAAERSLAQGVAAQQSRRPVEAIAAYRKATELDPSYFEAYYNLGLAASAGGNLAAALRAFETALTLKPDSVDARFNFAQALRQSNFLEDAIQELERVAAQSPNDSRAHLALGGLYATQLRQPAQARLHYLKALEADPRNPQADAVRYWLAANPP
jgi:tetratricopeptide (TPR) repeat protein